MMTVSSEIVCNLCGGTRHLILEDDQLPFRTLQCRDCSLIFVHPQPKIPELSSHYNDDYFSEWIGAQKFKRVNMWRRRLKRMERFVRKGKLLDVGCGDGAFLCQAKDSGWQVSGTELSPFAADYASHLLGTKIFCGELHNAPFPEKFFDAVTLWHVLEHTTDPRKYLNVLKRLLKQDGRLIIAVPNADDLIMKMAYRIARGKKLKLFEKGQKEIHLYHFTSETLKRYLDETGYECTKLSPDFGIIEPSKKVINILGAACFYLMNLKIFNAIEIHAVQKR